jgi:hypothetical protein
VICEPLTITRLLLRCQTVSFPCRTIGSNATPLPAHHDGPGIERPTPISGAGVLLQPFQTRPNDEVDSENFRRTP